MNYDSTGALHNSSYTSRTKHIAFRSFFFRQLVKSGRVSIHHEGTHDVLVDVAIKHSSLKRVQLGYPADQGLFMLKRRLYLTRRGYIDVSTLMNAHPPC